MRKTALLLFAGLAAVLLSSCQYNTYEYAAESSSSESSAHEMTMSEYATVKAILANASDAWDSGVYVYTADEDGNLTSEYTFTDSDGDGEYDDGEHVSACTTVENPRYDDDDIYSYYVTYDYASDDGTQAISGSRYVYMVYDGYDEVLAGESDTGKRYRTRTHDCSATVYGKEHTLVMTEYITTTYYVENYYDVLSKDYYTDSAVALDGVTLYGYEDYVNAFGYYV